MHVVQACAYASRKEGNLSISGWYDTEGGIRCRARVGENEGRHLDGELQDNDDEVNNGNGKL